MTRTWSNLTFTELMRKDPKRAFQYRLETVGTPIPEEYLDDTEKEAAKKSADSELEEKSNVEMLKTKLTEAGIGFHNFSGEKKLMELAKAHNLA